MKTSSKANFEIQFAVSRTFFNRRPISFNKFEFGIIVTFLLFRENIKGFSIRLFVKVFLVTSHKNRGYSLT